MGRVEKLLVVEGAFEAEDRGQTKGPQEGGAHIKLFQKRMHKTAAPRLL